MTMTSSLLRGGTRRMLLATLALALLYIAVSESFMALSMPVMVWYLERDLQPKLEREAAQVAAASAAREATLAPGHRLAAWHLGLNMGYASHVLGGVANSSPSEQQHVRSTLAEHFANAQRAAAFLQVEGPFVLESATVHDAANLRFRIEAADLAMGTLIAARLGPRHRHLFLLGMHVGMHLALLDLQASIASRDSNSSSRPKPPRTLIRRHATLAGLSPAQWEPLATTSATASYQLIAQDYRKAMAAAGLAVLAIPVAVVGVRSD
ncbi:hypothetical protein [Variovorax sp. J22R115]|uniref:hypothetical protein n=1 Tax=Variovorax sp. J22R115 TaxID=3053509 RepID=UPI0025754588|nr:hypothetical protein [Variovorax sp. J22R115]MDM0047939.1 hypothetical protein [Variovorax sp. J22R115]